MCKTNDAGLRMQWILEVLSMGSRIFNSSFAAGLFTLTKWIPSLESCQISQDMVFCSFQLESDETHGFSADWDSMYPSS